MYEEKKNLELNGKISSLELYENFIGQLNTWYMKNKKGEIPILDLSSVEWLDALCLPNLLAISTIIRVYHKTNFYVVLPYELRLVNFLKMSKFLEIGGRVLNLFDYDDEYVNKAVFFTNKEIREEHKVCFYKPDLYYYEIKNQNEQLAYRAKMYEHIRYIVVPQNYRKVIEDKNILTENEVDSLLDIISEIICNSILYSKSISYSFVQTDKFKSSFAISDVGIGFKNALLSKKNFDYELYKRYKMSFNDNKFDDFIIIMQILDYSMKQNRKNLWSLKSLIVNNGGILRIHNNSTQVIFTANKCSGCTKNAEGCLTCLKESYDNGLSNLRFFNGKLRGVHIEVELKNMKGGNLR